MNAEYYYRLTRSVQYRSNRVEAVYFYTHPHTLKRLQFPIRLAFAMSINKAQGQSLKVAGINLESFCFSHLQLYVACSIVETGKNLYVFAPDAKTENIVYQTALE